MTPSRTVQGYDSQRNQVMPKHDEDFNPSDYRITEVKLKRCYSRYNLPSWQHFDRVINLGSITGTQLVIGLTGKHQTVLKAERL
jgi:hypothetical protein